MTLPLVEGADGAADYDLTSLEAVRAFLQKNSGATYQDEVLQDLITAASSLINTQVARFLPTEDAATKTFIWRGGPLPLHPYFLRSVDTITYGTTNGADGSALSATDYRLRPMPAPQGVYRWLHFPGYLTYPSPDSEVEVTVTGDWGFETIPADVQHWATVTVSIWLRKDVAAFSSTLRLEEDRLERPSMLPSAVEAGLARYKQGAF